MIDLTEHKRVVLGGLSVVALAGAYSVFAATGDSIAAVGTFLALGVFGPLLLFYGNKREPTESTN
jgi:hypothetical protein